MKITEEKSQIMFLYSNLKMSFHSNRKLYHLLVMSISCIAHIQKHTETEVSVSIVIGNYSNKYTF